MKIYIEDNALTRPIKGIARYFAECAADLGSELREMGRDIKWLAEDKIGDIFSRFSTPLKTDQGYDILLPRPKPSLTPEEILAKKRAELMENVIDAEFEIITPAPKR